jgi:hypothetical protein
LRRRDQSFARPQWARIAARIGAAAGTIDYVDMDEPYYYYAHFFDGPQAYHWSTAAVVHEVGLFINELRGEFPNVIIGDAEVLTGGADFAAYQDWIDAFREVNGFSLPFLHMDVDWRRRAWPQEIKSLEEHGKTAGVAVGIIYNATRSTLLTPFGWRTLARVKRG